MITAVIACGRLNTRRLANIALIAANVVPCGLCILRLPGNAVIGADVSRTRLRILRVDDGHSHCECGADCQREQGFSEHMNLL